MLRSPVFLLVGVFAVVQAQEKRSPAAKQTRWSDPATWPDKKVPAKDAVVTIEKDRHVILDVSPPALRSVTINGTLSFADNKDLELTTEWVMVHGALEIGTEARPHTRKATITLTDNVKGEDIGVPAATVASERVDRGIMLMGGTLNLHGDRKHTWTKLANTASGAPPSPPALGGVTIDGKLSFADNKDLELTTEWIMLHGELEIGTEARPHTRKATITLTDNVKGEDIGVPPASVASERVDRGIMIMGGTLNLHGDQKHTWTKLANTATAGSTSIQVLDASGWRAGDEVVLASTDFDPRQAERRTIAAIRGNTITLDKKLDYMHFGKITFDVDERGEVGHADAQHRASGISRRGGAAVLRRARDGDGREQDVCRGRRVQSNGPEHDSRPISDPLASGRRCTRGSTSRTRRIHDTYNRCVTVHGTNFLRVENNVTYNTVGHCFFLEDGAEHGNQFVHNLAIQIKCHTSKACAPTNLGANGENIGSNPLNRATYRAASMSGKDTLLPSDNTVTAYWITNPDNAFIDNVAAGSDENGFWWSLPEHPQGKFEGTEISKAIWPRRTRMAEFRGNVAHSNFDGFMLDRNINLENVFGLAGPSHIAKENPADENSKSVESLLENLTAYKNRNGGVWGRGELHVFRNLKAADNAIGFTNSTGSFGADTFTSLVVDSLFVGETDNIGNPVTPEEKAYGRSLPKRLIPDFPIRAYEYLRLPS